jgi:hypothetical protein
MVCFKHIIVNNLHKSNNNDNNKSNNNNNSNNATKILQQKQIANVNSLFRHGTHHISMSNIAEEQYIKRNDKGCAELHFNIRKEIEAKLDNKHWYDHVPKSVETSHAVKVTVLWNQQVRTNRIIPYNTPDIVNRDN